jgi:hypothetical protein
MSHSTWIRWLDASDHADEQSITQLGGKGANLARLQALGLPTPAGFVITTAAYDDFVAANLLAHDLATDPHCDPDGLSAVGNRVRGRGTLLRYGGRSGDGVICRSARHLPERRWPRCGTQGRAGMLGLALDAPCGRLSTPEWMGRSSNR